MRALAALRSKMAAGVATSRHCVVPASRSALPLARPITLRLQRPWRLSPMRDPARRSVSFHGTFASLSVGLAPSLLRRWTRLPPSPRHPICMEALAAHGSGEPYRLVSLQFPGKAPNCRHHSAVTRYILWRFRHRQFPATGEVSHQASSRQSEIIAVCPVDNGDIGDKSAVSQSRSDSAAATGTSSLSWVIAATSFR